jgi:hypothetical protein
LAEVKIADSMADDVDDENIIFNLRSDANLVIFAKWERKL